MKTILLSLLILIIPTLSFSQNNNLPQYFIEGGDTIGILLSIEQVQKLDNNSQLLDLFKQLQIEKRNEKKVVLFIAWRQCSKIILTKFH